MSSGGEGVQRALKYCGVPQCESVKSKNTSLHAIPKYVLSSEILREKWKTALKMKKDFSKSFRICCHHFQKRQVITGIQSGRAILTQKAFPTLKLPHSGIARNNVRSTTRKPPLKTRSAGTRSKKTTEEGQPSASPEIVHENVGVSTGTQCIGIDKAVQVNTSWYLTDLCTTDYKLNTLTGIPTLAILKGMLKSCRLIRTDDDCSMPLKDRILMTMLKLKANVSFAAIAISFQITENNAKLYFADCIKLLAEVTEPLIYWQSQEENHETMPECFEPFSNVITVLECLEVTLRCLTCATCSLQCQEDRTIHVLVGFSPSGLVNFVGPISNGKQFGQAKFNLKDLIKKLNPNDAVMVGEGLMIGEELLNAGIEIIKPAFHYSNLSEEELELDKQICRAKVHVQRQFEKLQEFNVLFQTISASVQPYVIDIVTIICGISNL